MLTSNIAFELDRNAIYLRNQELNLHHNKFNSIQKRKNKYLHTTTSEIPSSRINSVDRRYFLTKGNEYLFDKLIKISSRSNKTISDNKAFNNFMSKKNKAMQAIRELNEKKMNEFNNDYRRRILSVNSVVDLKKMENDFKVTRKVYKQLRKVQPNQSAANLFTSYHCTVQTKMNKRNKLPPLNINKE